MVPILRLLSNFRINRTITFTTRHDQWPAQLFRTLELQGSNLTRRQDTKFLQSFQHFKGLRIF